MVKKALVSLIVAVSFSATAFAADSEANQPSCLDIAKKLGQGEKLNSFEYFQWKGACKARSMGDKEKGNGADNAAAGSGDSARLAASALTTTKPQQR